MASYAVNGRSYLQYNVQIIDKVMNVINYIRDEETDLNIIKEQLFRINHDLRIIYNSMQSLITIMQKSSRGRSRSRSANKRSSANKPHKSPKK
jgi:hypothetical protein